MGPCESDCPAAILDELTETDSTYASEWRARCRANLVRRKLERAKPVPKPGQTIVFDEPIRFNDGEIATASRSLPIRRARPRYFAIP
jgi:hypothetical protein